MPSKKYLALFAVTLIAIYGLVKIAPISRAASDSDQIPSDLSLDLDQAQKDPTPVQRQIISSQTAQAKIVTDKGEQAVIAVKDEVPKEVKLQSAKDAENPEQSTSEQVVNKTVEGDQGQAVPADSPADNATNNPVSSPADINVIPGTNILEPDDNTAPQLPAASINPINSGQNQNNPAASPAGTDDFGQSTVPQPASSTNSAPEFNTPAPTNAAGGGEQSNTIPPENPPAETQPVSNNSSGSDNSTNQSSGNNDSSSGSGSSGGDNSAVQGVSTQAGLPWWQVLLNKFLQLRK